jgi:hypothetical protein
VHVALFVLGVAWAVERSLQGPPVVASAVTTAVQVDTLPLSAAVSSAATRADAEELCVWLNRMPRERRARCAGEPVGVTLERACTHSLVAAFERGTIALDPEAHTRCIEQQRARATDCGVADAAAVSCDAVWHGQLVAGASCRSSLECADGLHCDGVLGPLSPGVCRAPQVAGAACGDGIDALTVYLPQAAPRHSECAGRCLQGTCVN